MDEQDDYDDSASPPNPHPLAALFTRPRLVATGVGLSGLSLFSCAFTIVPGPDGDAWQTAITFGSALLAIAAFAAALVGDRPA